MSPDKNLQYTIHTQAIEGRKPSATAVQLCRKMSAGSISAEDAIQQIKKVYGLNGTSRHV